MCCRSTDGTRRRDSLESALPAMPLKWRPRLSADYLATRPKRLPVVLSCHRSGPDGFRAIAPTKASIPESGISISNPIRPDNHKETAQRSTRPTSGPCKMRWQPAANRNGVASHCTATLIAAVDSAIIRPCVPPSMSMCHRGTASVTS